MGVAEAFGATVTKANGRVGCMLAGAAVPHPASSRLARSTTQGFLFIDQGLGGSKAVVAVAVGVEVKVLVGISVEVAVGVSVGGGSVVAVGVSVCEGVAVGKSGMLVMPGVRVGTFGTQSRWPVKIIVEDPIQLARCN